MVVNKIVPKQVDDPNWLEYFIDDTNVLKNNFGIVSGDALFYLEEKEVLKNLTYLHLNPLNISCSVDKLLEIHKFIFGSIYPFAGQYRKCTLSKNGYNFVDPDLIESELFKTINHYSILIDKVKSRDEYAFVLAPFYYDLIRIHPFREGNGRTIREFIREVVLEKNQNLSFCVELDYTKMDKNKLLLGTKERYLYPSLLEMEFMAGLVPLEDKKERYL